MRSPSRSRITLVGAVSALTLLATAACSNTQPSDPGAEDTDVTEDAGTTDDRVLVIADGGGSYHTSQMKTTFDPFEQATGITLDIQSYDYSLGAIKAQARGAGSWDVVSIGNPISDAEQADLFAPIDYSIVNDPGLPEDAKLEYQALYVGYARVPAYRSDKFDVPPETWADLWDVAAFPGTRQMENYPVGTLEVALMADGVAPENLYPLDIERALAKLDALIDTSDVIWWSAGAEMVQNFANGIADIGVGWNGRLIQAQNEDIPVGYSLHGAIIQGTSWAIMKDSDKKDLAMEFIAFATSPEVGAADTADFLGNVPMNIDSIALLDDELASTLPNSPANIDDIAGWVDWTWWSDNFDPVYEQWQDWFASH